MLEPIQSQASRLKIAMQKSGRLSEECHDLLIACGIKVHWKKDTLIAYAKNMPIEILRVRDDDIPNLIFDGVVDLGFVGQNVLEEIEIGRKNLGQPCGYLHLRTLEFGECRLSLAVPKDTSYQGVHSLEGKRIATSYPNLLKQYMTNQGISYQTCLLTGSVEVAPMAGIAHAICDLVSSGATLEANGLVETQVIYRSKACLIQKYTPIDADKQALITKILTRIQGISQASESKYIMLHAPKDKLDVISSLLSGVENPTILPLAHDDTKVAMHMVSQETFFWETMEQLKEMGASSILVLPIEKMLL